VVNYHLTGGGQEIFPELQLEHYSAILSLDLSAIFIYLGLLKVTRIEQQKGEYH